MYRINEDVAKSNKIVKEIDSLRIFSDEIDKIKRVVEELKEYLVKNNSVGYLGTFTQILYNMAKLMYFDKNSGFFERNKYNIDQRIRKGRISLIDFKVSDVALLRDFISIFKKSKRK